MNKSGAQVRAHLSEKGMSPDKQFVFGFWLAMGFVFVALIIRGMVRSFGWKSSINFVVGAGFRLGLVGMAAWTFVVMTR